MVWLINLLILPYTLLSWTFMYVFSLVVWYLIGWGIYRLWDEYGTGIRFQSPIKRD